jgi:hypothetical protein
MTAHKPHGQRVSAACGGPSAGAPIRCFRHPDRGLAAGPNEEVFEMARKTQRNLISFGRATAAVKSWVIGWTANEAHRAATARSQTMSRPCPGAYGLLVDTHRR